MIQDGYVVTTTVKNGQANGESVNEYLVHLSHRSDIDCSELLMKKLT